MLTQSRLKELLHYDPNTGTFVWRSARQGVRVGGVAGCINGNGYQLICVDYRLYMSHRLAWLYVYGAWPEHEIDHINGIRDDNRIANLREATRAENAQNRAKQSNNTSGLIGVHWDSTKRKWISQIKIDGATKHLGVFDTPESAHAAYCVAKAGLHTFQPALRKDVKAGKREIPGFKIVEVV